MILFAWVFRYLHTFLFISDNFIDNEVKAWAMIYSTVFKCKYNFIWLK